MDPNNDDISPEVALNNLAVEESERLERKLLSKCFSVFAKFTNDVRKRRSQNEEQLSKVRAQRKTGVVVRQWWIIVRERKKNIQYFAEYQKLRHLQLIFSAWLKVAGTEKDNAMVSSASS